MIDGFVCKTLYIPNGLCYAVDTNGNRTVFIKQKKNLAYFSQTCDSFGLYSPIPQNLVGAKRLFLKSVKRQRKIIYGNTYYRKYIAGLYTDIVYFDFKHFYQEIFSKIANHIDEGYFGKEVKGIVARKQFMEKEIQRAKYSQSALKKPLVDIKDIAKNSIHIDANKDKQELIEFTARLASADNADKADGIVAKITRNALAYGFGYQQKNASVSNISALVMFFAKQIMELTINELEARQNKIVFSHTDSFMTSHIQTKDIDDSIKFATEQINEAYFGGVKILNFDLGSISIKDKFEELMVLNNNAYIYKDRNGVGIAVAGINTTKNNGLGITRKGEKLDDILNDNAELLFSKDRNEFLSRYEDTEFMYSLLKYRLDENYEKRLSDLWEKGEDKELQKQVVEVSKTMKDIKMLCNNINKVAI
ncbi:MAG: hypothetical protein QXH07_04635 [Thermoplasmata archaeon]